MRDMTGESVAAPHSEGKVFGWARLCSSLRVQLAACLAIGVALPAVIFYRGNVAAVSGSVLVQNTVLLAALAISVAVVLIRKFGEFPGTVGARYIFPSFAATYSCATVLILLLRAPYSGALLFLTFVASLIVRFLMNAVERRGDNILYYLVPGGNIDRLLKEVPSHSVVLTQPRVPSGANAVLVADLHFDHPAEWERAFAAAALSGIGVYHYKQVWEAQTGKVRIEHLSENGLGSLLPSNPYAKVKRAIDISLTIVALPILLVPLAVVAMVIRLDSPGPVFFRQERIGYRGQSFRVLKFRTMREVPLQDGTDQVHAAITRDDDDRITRFGRFLRQTRIDELPQILNILRGEMSWIGPRPEARPLSEWYEREIPFYSYRHIVRPGITGWAQVNQGHVAGISEVHDKLRYDFYYIKNFSMWLDLVVLFRTVLVVVHGIGAK